MKRKILLISFIVLLLALRFQLPAQVVITNDSTAADSSAMLDVKSTEKGVAYPRLTLEQIQSISDPAIGLTVFCTTDDQFYTFTGSDTAVKSAAGGGAWKLTGGSINVWPSPMCVCVRMVSPQTIFSCCPSDPGFAINPPGFIWNFLNGCLGPILYSWDGPNGTTWSPLNPPAYVDPSLLDCGKYTYTWKAWVGSTLYCSYSFFVYVFPKCLTIKNLKTGLSQSTCPGGPPLEFCEGEEGLLSTGCSDFEVSWDFKDGSSLLYTYWCKGPPPLYLPTPCTGNPANTNQLDITCPSSWSGDYAVQRTYRATFDRTKVPAGWPAWPVNCQDVFTIQAKIYCPTVAGTISVMSSHPILSGYKICSDLNGDCQPDYPINLTLNVNGYLGHIIRWNSFYTTSSTYTPPPIYAKGVYTYEVEVQNGTCYPRTTLVTVTVEDPFCPVICSNKDLVCPNTTDDVISICNGPVPGGLSIQWYYQINCTGTWYPSPVPGPYDPSNGTSQNTNLIGDQNPWYNFPKVPGPLTTSLCWKVVITPGPGAACSTVTSSSQNPTPFHGRIDLFQKPGTPGISVTPLPPQCCGTTFTLTATAPTTGTTPFYFEWFHDGKSEWVDPTPGTAGSISNYVVTAPGDYLVRVYNRDHCDYTESAIIHIVCCSVNLTVTAPCCSDGVTPITLIANATSTCNSNPINYLWTGPPPFSSVLSTVVLNPPPTNPPDTWSYTVTATDAMGCHSSKTVSILACP